MSIIAFFIREKKSLIGIFIKINIVQVKLIMIFIRWAETRYRANITFQISKNNKYLKFIFNYKPSKT